MPRGGGGGGENTLVLAVFFGASPFFPYRLVQVALPTSGARGKMRSATQFFWQGLQSSSHVSLSWERFPKRRWQPMDKFRKHRYKQTSRIPTLLRRLLSNSVASQLELPEATQNI